VIGTRTATALAFLLSIVGVAVGVTAIALSLRDDGDDTSNLLQTRIDRVDGDPIPFPLHDFYLSGDSQGVPRALYMYPPGYYGHVRGCKVVWLADDSVEVDGRAVGPGLFVDPCGGARFERDGRLVAGPADRGLDWFSTRTEIGGAVVDLDRLQCGSPGRTDVPVIPAPSATIPPNTPQPARTPGPATLTPTATQSPTAVPTVTPTTTNTITATPESDECERVDALTRSGAQEGAMFADAGASPDHPTG
jgi:hypothetical protein